MASLSAKLKNFPPEKLEKLIEEHNGKKYCIKPSSIKKMYQNWLRNTKENRGFEKVFTAKYNTRLKKMEREALEFCSYQVGYIVCDWDTPSYEVHLVGEPVFTVKWLPEFKATKQTMLDSLDKFCHTNSVRLLQAGQPSTLLIETVYSS